MELLENNFQVEYWAEDKPIPRESLMSGVKDKDGLLCLLTDKIDKQVVECGGDLKVVATMSVGCDHLDVQLLRDRNIRIGYTPDVLTAATADLTVSLLLATSRRILEGNQALKSGGWSSWSPLWLCGPALRGSTVGIVGLGRIGQAVQNRLVPFGVGKFVYSGRSKKPQHTEAGASFVSFDDLVSSSDFVIITTSYTEEMKHLFDQSVFKKMKNSAILINISRGGIINQDDLVEALDTKEIYAAGLDVMVPEPLPTDHPLAKLDNCVLLPHLGSAETETRQTMALMTVNNIITALKGDTMPAEY